MLLPVTSTRQTTGQLKISSRHNGLEEAVVRVTGGDFYHRGIGSYCILRLIKAKQVITYDICFKLGWIGLTYVYSMTMTVGVSIFARDKKLGY